MRTLRYLNVVLTVIAVLLALQLWTLWSGQAVQGPAQVAFAAPPSPGGIPNPGAQRQEQVNLLKQLNVQMGQLITLFRSGDARVRVAGEGREQGTANRE